MRIENALLLKTLTHLFELGIRGEIYDLHLSDYFTVVQLTDNRIGAAMSYYDHRLANTARDLVLDYFRDCAFMADQSPTLSSLTTILKSEVQTRLVVASVLTSYVSALSSAIIRQGGDSAFKVSDRPPWNWPDGIETALVVGFGGYLYKLARQKHIRTLHVIDTSYDLRRQQIDTSVQRLSIENPSISITVSTSLGAEGSSTCIKRFDLLSITGSTLCNGTLEGFLERARRDSQIVLQGQSASVHPKVLFDEGINWITTTIKPKNLMKIARDQREPRRFREVLESYSLPAVYLHKCS